MRKFTISGISGTIVVATLSLFFFFSDAVPQAVAEEVVVADRIIAVVNDDVITLSELENAFMPYEKMIKETLQGADAVAEMERGRKILLIRLINELLLGQEAKRLSLIFSERDADAQIDTIIKQRGITLEDLQKELLKEGFTLQKYKEFMRKELSRRRVIETEIVPRITVSDEEVGNFYAENLNIYETREAVRLQQIMLPFTVKGSEEEEKALQKKMLTISELIKKGEPFEQLVAQYSQGPGAKEGGNIGFVERGMLFPELEQVIFSLDVGAISNIVKTPAGLHIFKVAEKRGGDIPLPVIREDIEKRIRSAKINARIEEYTEKLRKKASIQIRLQ